MRRIPGRTLAVLIGSLALIAALGFLAEGRLGKMGYGLNPGPNSFSTSAIGFAGLYKMCEAVYGEVGRKSSLGEEANLRRRLHVATGISAPSRPELFEGAVLVILPKWSYSRDPETPAWVGQLSPMPETIPRLMADDSQPGEVELVRAVWPKRFQMALEAPEPTGSAPLQLLRGKELVPIISTPDGILLARSFVDGAPVIILSDPDIANNMGLSRGRNPELMRAILDFIAEIAKTTGPPVFLEGRGESASDGPLPTGGLLGPLFRFPMIIVTILTILTIALVILPAGRRFGGSPAEEPAPAFGKSKLIDNAARLLARSGHAGEALDSYLDLNLRAAGRLTRAPEGLDRPRLMEWLAAAGRDRGLSASPEFLARRAAALRGSNSQAAILALAGDIREWRMELEHGSKRHRRHRR